MKINDTFAGFDFDNIWGFSDESTYKYPTLKKTKLYNLTFSITFKNADGTEISKCDYHYGESVTMPDTPYKASDDTYAYIFSGWDKEVTDCMGDATYIATYTATYIDYTVAFNDWDGTVLSSKVYHWGDTVTVPTDPSRTADNTYTYTFADWDKDVVACSGNETYTAIYTPNYIDYTVVFKDWDGTVLSSEIYHYGDDVPAPISPARQGDDNYIYLFDGWNEPVSSCKGNIIYTAVYSKTDITILSISVTTKPNKLIYFKGDSFDDSGMIVTAYYNNDTSKTITDYLISGYSSDVGEKTITVSYEGKISVFNVTVIPCTTTLKYVNGEIIIEVPSSVVQNGSTFSVDKIEPPPEDVVEKVKDKYGAQSSVISYYEIMLFDQDNNRIFVLDNEITIKMKLPDKYLKGYIIKVNQEDDDGNLIEMTSWIEDGYVCYKTNWLEKY